MQRDSIKIEQDHMDWMFEVDGKLWTWATAVAEDLSADIQLTAERLPDHRLLYLEHEGKVSGDRGSVRRLVSGIFKTETRCDKSFIAVLKWADANREHNQRLTIQRNLTSTSFNEETRDAWTLRLESFDR